jgi:hypothetical protein
MDSNNRWHFNPFDKVQPLRQHENRQEQDLTRSQSLNELHQQQRQPVSVVLFDYAIYTLILDFFPWSTTCGSCMQGCSISHRR